MNSPLVFPLINATRHTFETMLHMQVDFDPIERQCAAPSRPALSAAVEISGDAEGTVFLRFPLETARRVVNVFSGGVAASELEDLADAIGELAVIIAGSANRTLAGANLDVSFPTTSTNDVHDRCYENEASVAIPCSCDCGEFAIEIVTRTVATAGTAA